MTTRVQKWGHSLAVRIPRAVAHDSQLTLGAKVEVTCQEGTVLIVPVNETRYRLEDLLAGVTRRNLHGEVTTGVPTGSEVW